LQTVERRPTVRVVSTATIEQPGEIEASFVPVGHYAHPRDPSKRTALCGDPILGVPTFGTFEVCTECQEYAAAQDWAPLPAAS
jgi:hypothetical protein